MTASTQSENAIAQRFWGTGALIGLGILAAWFIAIATLATRGAFVAGEGQLPVAIVIAVATPPAIFALSYVFAEPVRDWVASLDMALVTGIQTWRVVGAAFLFLWGMGQLPGVFSLPAGAGDVAVGILALWVTLAVATERPNWQRRVWWLIIAGMADFAVAITTGILSDAGRILAFEGAASGQIVQMFPLALIPAFLVPVFMIAHLIAGIKLITGR